MAVEVKNKRLLVICGKSGSGKTTSLRNLDDQEGVVFLNCESGKEIPFRNKFQQEIITDPLDIPGILQEIEETDDVHTVVIDSINFMMDMFESLYIYGATDSRQGWADYAQFWKDLMQQHISKSTKRYILIAHVDTEENEETGIAETFIPVKGSLKRSGLEAYFSIVIMARTMPVKKLTEDTELLKITKREQAVGIKYVFQTMKTKDTTGSRIRGPMDLWQDEEVFIDNDAGMVLDILDEHYGS